jgi:hypothetical protein
MSLPASFGPVVAKTPLTKEVPDSISSPYWPTITESLSLTVTLKIRPRYSAASTAVVPAGRETVLSPAVAVRKTTLPALGLTAKFVPVRAKY